jgi:hypothetical protein
VPPTDWSACVTVAPTGPGSWLVTDVPAPTTVSTTVGGLGGGGAGWLAVGAGVDGGGGLDDGPEPPWPPKPPEPPEPPWPPEPLEPP